MNTGTRAFGPVALLCLALCVLMGTGAARSQTDFENTIRQFNGDAIQGWIQPVADMFGANMHSGYYHSAEIEPWGFHMRLDIVGMASMVKDDQKTYTVKTPAGFTPATAQAPTVFGGKASSIPNPVAGLQPWTTGSDGVFNTSYFPLAAPQLTIGNIYGTQLMARFVTTPTIENVPKVTMWGLGGRHSISQYFAAFPVDVAAGINFNSFTFGDMIDFKGVAFNAQASKSWSILTVYTGLQWEKSTMNLSYTPNGLAPVSVALSGANNFRFTAGLDLGLGPIHLFGDGNFGSVTAVSAGIGFGN